MGSAPGDTSAEGYWSRIRLLLFGLGLSVSIGMTGVLWFDVFRRVDDLSVTRSDNTQWTIGQLEVDTLRFTLALQGAQGADAASLAEVRQRFDIFYSRFRTLTRGKAYQSLFEDEDYLRAHGAIDAFLDRQIPLIDGPDAELQAALPDMAAEARQVHDLVRDLALRGLQVFAAQSDRQRSEVVGLILRTGFVTVLQLVVLFVVLLMMLRTGRRAAAFARRTAEAHRNLEMIVNSSLDAIVVADESGVVRVFNPAAEETFGWTREEAIGCPMTALMIPEHHRAGHEAGMRRFVETGEKRVIGAGRVQLEARHKSGRIFPVELSLRSEEDETGRIFVSFMRDITRRREAEDALTSARDDALAAARKKAEFLAVMSHEIRTPLNGMLGAIELLGDTALDDRQRRWLETLEGSGQLLLQHVNDVLDLSSIDAGRSGLRNDAVDLRALCAEVIATQDGAARRAGNASSSVVSDAVPQRVSVDGRRLSQVLLNLVGNAHKFTRDGTVRLVVDARPGAEGRSDLTIHVTDTGPGIRAEDRERIFEEFVMLDSSYHRNATGTGLGLAISRRIVQAMGGRIEVLDAPGGGADFRIDLTLETVEPDTEAGRATGDAIGEPQRGPLDVLLVEDNDINRAILVEMLERDGHAVTEAVDGQDAVARAEERAFDLVLMDISMPGMDGVEATRRIRAGTGPNARTPIVAVTAHAMPEEVERFRAAGMGRTVTKPVSRAVLRDLLRQMQMGGASGTASSPRTGRGSAEIMDTERLAELTETMGETRFTGLVAKFLEEGDAMAEAAGGAAPQDDPRGFVMRVHALAGAAGLLGAQALSEALVEAEAGYKRDGSAVPPERCEALVALWAETRAAYEELTSE